MMIFYPSKHLHLFGLGLFLILASLGSSAAQVMDPGTAGNLAPLPDDSGPTPGTPDNSQSGNNSQTDQQGNGNSQDNGSADNSGNSSQGGNAQNNGPIISNGGSQSTQNGHTYNVPMIPQQGASPYGPLSTSQENQSQSYQYTTPALYNTGANSLSQIATNNALAQAFGSSAGAGFSADQGMSYSNPLFGRIKLGPFDFKASVATNLVRDDNITAGQSSGQKLSDTSWSVTPAIVLEYGNHEGQRGYASVVYAPTLTRYFHYSGENSDNQNVAFSANYGFQRLSLNASETYTQITGINQDISARTTQNASVSRLGATYGIDDKLALSSQVQYVNTSYANGGGFGDEIATLSNTLAYQLSNRITIGPAFNVGIETPQGGQQQTFEEPGIALTYIATDKITLSGHVGADLRQAGTDSQGGGGGTTISPNFNIGVGYDPFDSTKLSLYGYESVQASSGNTAQTVQNTGVGFSASQRILHRFFLGFTFSYTHSQYNNTGGTGEVLVSTPGSPGTNFVATAETSGSTQDNIVYRPSFTFSPTLWSSVGLYYQYLDNEVTGSGVGYHDNQAGVSASIQF